MQANIKSIFLVLIIVLTIILLALVAYLFYKQYSAPQPVACTMEAKICPDGSYVGRTGPNCEFAQCPEVIDNTTNWEKYTNTEYGFEIKFPEAWKGYSIVTNSWTGELINTSTTYKGPLIIFKNATLETENNFDGIPIMVITPEVWSLIEEEKVAVSAAPIGPQKIGQNEKYFFATPPRWYGFADDLNQEQTLEIQEIVKTFKAF